MASISHHGHLPLAISTGAGEIDWSTFLDRPLFTAACADDFAVMDKTVLITGAGGSIGSALAERLMGGLASKLLLLDSSEQNLLGLHKKYSQRHVTLPETEFFHVNILDERRLQEIFSIYQPQIVFHSAAMKHVPQLEQYPFMALENNLLGTVRLLEALDSCPLEYFVNVSTDKAVNPASILGVSKRISELLLLSLETGPVRCFSLRLGNVLGSSGSVVRLFIQSLRKHESLQITDPLASRYFLTLDEVVALLLKSLELSGNSLLLPELGKPQKIVRLADFLLDRFGVRPNAEILTVIGLRDGEKQSEQLIYGYEDLEATSIPQLYRIRGSKISDSNAFIENLGQLLELVRARQARPLMEALMAIVPEYIPSPTFLRHVH